MWKILLLNALILIFFGVAVTAYPVILAVIVATFFVVTGVWLLIWSIKLKKIENVSMGYVKSYGVFPDDSSIEYIRVRTF